MLELVKALCNRDIYEQIGKNVPVTAFEKEPKKIVETIISAQDTYDTSINLSELENLFFSNNNSLTKAQEDSYRLLFAKMRGAEDISIEVAKDVMHNLWRIEVGRRVAEIGYALTEGEEKSLDNLSKLIDDYASGFVTDSSPFEGIDLDPQRLIASMNVQTKWAFNVSSLAERVSGVSAGHFVVVGSRPETGKTSSHASFAMGPYGWIEQGARVHVLCNEEPANRVALRYLSAATNKTEDQLLDGGGSTINGEWKKDNLFIDRIDEAYGIEGIEAHIKQTRPDILVIDMLDKVTLPDNKAVIPQHEKLREIYRRTRDLATRYECSIFGYSQLSADAEGRVNLNLSMMENSKTGKAAEADLMILIGKYAMIEGASEDDPRRVFNIVKNKISGWHGQINVMLDGRVARYDD
jgi:replicative DNA helicase